MKTLLLLSICLLSSCVFPSSTTILVKDANDSPVWNFPLRIELSDGLLMSDGQGKLNGEVVDISTANDRMQSIVVRTDLKGKTKVPYFMRDKQPSWFRQLFPGAELVSDQSVTVTPLQDLPKGSKIHVSFPNP